MIQLTRLNNHPLVINSDLIKSIESSPDTVLTLVTGEKILARESVEDVLEKIVEFRRRILSGLPIQPVLLPSSGSRSPVNGETPVSNEKA
jgi:flagellar protein FlbD